MVTVKTFGMFRLKTGLKEIQADVSSVKQLYPILLEEAKKVNPTSTITAADIDGCIVVINGKQKNKGSRLKDGDIVFLMPPVSGG